MFRKPKARCCHHHERLFQQLKYKEKVKDDKIEDKTERHFVKELNDMMKDDETMAIAVSKHAEVFSVMKRANGRILF